MGLLGKTPDDVDKTVIEDNIIRKRVASSMYTIVDDLNDIKFPESNKIYLCINSGHLNEYIWITSEWQLIRSLTEH